MCRVIVGMKLKISVCGEQQVICDLFTGKYSEAEQKEPRWKEMDRVLCARLLGKTLLGLFPSPQHWASVWSPSEWHRTE